MLCTLPVTEISYSVIINCIILELIPCILDLGRSIVISSVYSKCFRVLSSSMNCLDKFLNTRIMTATEHGSDIRRDANNGHS